MNAAPERTAAAAALLLLSASPAATQSVLPSRIHPITAPIRHAGVVHLGTGTWTRHAQTANLTGPDIIYNNTCEIGYYGWQNQNERWSHRSCVPSPTHPFVPTVVAGATGYDEAPGCHASYVVNGFEIAYCSRTIGTVDYQLGFQDNYTVCGGGPMVPTQVFNVTGLPGGTSTGGERCWIVDIDLAAAGLSFTMLADGTGTYVSPVTVDQFGWSWMPTSVVTSTGPIIAGNYTSQGFPAHPSVPCKGTDGTIWDSPINLAEQGTGMASNDFFRLDGSGATVAPGCYFLTGVHFDFWLELYSDANCPPPQVMTSFCHPGVNGVIACPCGNPPAATGHGCDNSSATGGAVLAGSSTTASASLSNDQVVLTTAGERLTALSIVIQGNSSYAQGLVFGQGVRCVTGSIKRLYVKTASGGSITAPEAGDPSVSARSAALGDPIPAGSSRYYSVYYRDPIVLGGCPAASAFNATQGGILFWQP